MIDVQEDLHDSDDTRDAIGEDLSEESIEDVDFIVEPRIESASSLLPHGEKRRSTFTFTMDAATVDDLPDYESLDGLAEDDTDETRADAPTEDATLARLFRSPVKGALQLFGTSEEIKYPKLPLSDDDLESRTDSMPVAREKQSATPNTDDYMHDVVEESVCTEEREGIVTEQEALTVIEQQTVDTMSEDVPDVPPVAEPTLHVHSLESSSTELPAASTEISYPALPVELPLSDSVESATSPSHETRIEPVNEDAATSEMLHCSPDENEHADIGIEKDVVLDTQEDEITDEEFTEASLQLNIQRDFEDTSQEEQSVMEEAVEPDARTYAHRDAPETVADFAEPMDENDHSSQHEDAPVKTQMVDITDGLTLSFTPAKAPLVESAPRKLHSPPPPPVQSGLDDATMTIALDDDTALLKGFLNRVAASKAEKAAVMTHRRESLQNRRDSDVIRHALASPRKVLEDKDPNSPSKYDNDLTLDLSQTMTLSMPDKSLASPTDPTDRESPADEESLRGSRRSSRAKKSRLPAPASAAQAQTSKIAIRRADGTEHVVLKKSDAQELSLLTRNNTRKNKQGAFCVTVRLLKLAVDAANLPPLDDSTRELVVGKNIRWDEQLAYYQENPETVADRESLATPDELGMPDAASTPSAKPKSKVSKNSTPKIRRVRGLGSTNGTPGKVLHAPSPFLPETIEDEKEAPPAPTAQQQLPRPKASKIKKMPVASASAAETKLPSLDVVPVGVEPAKERKSRLAAPKKVMLPQPVAALPAEGKENTQRTGISGATPKKGIPAPKVIVPASVGMESGLPRRRGRKL